MKAEQAWQSVLGQLQTEMPKASYDTWVRDTQVLSYEDGLLTIGVDNACLLYTSPSPRDGLLPRMPSSA